MAQRRRKPTPSWRITGVFVIPDILCNGGGVVVSYFRVGAKPPVLLLGRRGGASSMENTLIASLEAVNGAMDAM